MMSVLVVGLFLALAATVGLAGLALFDVAYRRPLMAAGATASGLRAHGESSDCATCRFHMIGVTPPEALAIASSIRRTQTPDEVRRIHELAVTNSQRTAKLDRQHFAAAQVACPLVGQNDACVTFADRPLHCRGWCWHSDDQGDRCLMADSEAGAGIVSGLQAAGLEGDVYELNSALAVALESPDVAHRWGQSQEVFANCKRYG